ncbi:MAG: aminotransferase class IV [Anaerolineae bacterium]
MIVYFNGEFLPKEEVRISPDDRGFLFADGVYEVMCAFDGQPFMAEAHYRRLSRSLEELRLPSQDMERLRRAVTSLLARNRLEVGGAKLYVQVTRGVAPRSHAFPDEPVPPTVYATASPYTPPEDAWETGASAIVVPDLRWARCDIKSLMLLPNVLASQQAKEAGAYDAILVRDGTITEGSHTSVCAILEGRLVTHPLTHRILGGVTRDVVLELCRELAIPVLERPIREDELDRAEELMLLGTTTGVMPIVEVGTLSIADGRPGPLTRRLQRVLHARMMGR